VHFIRPISINKTLFAETGQAGPKDVMDMAKALRKSSHIHPKVWYEAMMKMHFEREDMSGMLMPGPLDAMPDTFIPGESWDRGFRSLTSLGRSGKKGKKGKGVSL